jgi:hypothetical protein
MPVLQWCIALLVLSFLCMQAIAVVGMGGLLKSFSILLACHLLWRGHGRSRSVIDLPHAIAGNGRVTMKPSRGLGETGFTHIPIMLIRTMPADQFSTGKAAIPSPVIKT